MPSNPITVLRDHGLQDLLAGEAIETLADGFAFTEGPLWIPEHGLIFQDLKSSRTHRLALDVPGASAVVREQTQGANGQTFAPDSRVLFCEQDGRRISAINPDGSGYVVVAEHWQAKRLNSPNDLVIRSDGLVYFTDPAYGVTPEAKEIPFQGVYVLDLSHANAPRLLVDDFEKPNGLAFSPDESTLYICDTGRYHVRAFEVQHDGGLRPGSGRVFCTLDPGAPGGPDGMKVDQAGRVYIAVALGVWVFEADGTLLGILSMPRRPSNLAWCGRDADTLAITAVDAVHRVRFKINGILPRFTPKPFVV